MEDKSSNKVLLQSLRHGDKIAFYRLYVLYSKRLYGFILQYVKQESDAEEILQDVFVKLWQQRKKIDLDLSFDSYIFTIAYNTTISVLRKRVSENKYLDYLKSIQMEEPVFELTDEIYSEELRSKIESLLEEITPRQKEIFQLSRYQGLTNSKIAEKLDISVHTVKKHLSNTIYFLKQRIVD